ncbi:transglutaminase-like domain-containing protein [Candidatus Woesearchaeota archaeon]|nr:transglutaminase-like domain-containing protein [Candidatus Woesearchaeota archaeon]
MKKILFIVICFLLLAITAVAEDYDWVYKARDAELDINVSTFFYRGRDVNSITADLTLYPKETYRESILEQHSEPSTEVPYIFQWLNPSDVKISFSVQSRVRTDNIVKAIQNKVKFPLEESYQEYTHSTETIDSDDNDIIALATQLAAGEDDQYIVVHKLASWVEENIHYSLDTTTEKASQKASWVLENKRGVCDELTNLFIALARSLDIPARFVSGTAYSNSPDFGEGWGPHGWAEIYYPDYGWVPYDITYRQFGWIDISHITLKESTDPADPSVRYSWAGSDIESGQLDIDVKVRKYSGYETDRIELDANIQNKQAGFGSYNLIEATIKNIEDYYQTVELRIGYSETLELEEENYKMVALSPGESKTVYWQIKIKDDLNPDYKYTSFVKIKTLEEEKQLEFSSVKQDRIFSEQEIEESAKNIDISETKIYSHDVQISCNIESDAFYIYETKEVLCEVRNIGSREHYNLQFCFDKECAPLDLAIDQKYSQRFDFKPEFAGEQDLKFTVKSSNIFNVDIIPITVYKAPELNIDLDYPEEVEYEDTILLNFSVSEKTSDVKDMIVKVYLEDELLQEETIKDLTLQRFLLRVPATFLKKGENIFRIDIAYKDFNDKNYKTKETFKISLVNVTFFQNIKLFFMRLLN